MKTKHILLLFIIVIAGIAVSGYLTSRHFEILKTGFEYKSICDINAKFDCDSVIISSFSKLGPLPVSGLGLLFYLYLFLSLAYSFINKENAAKALAIPLLMTYPAIAFSIYLGLVSSFVLQTFCLFCVSLYLINLLTFLFIHLFFPLPANTSRTTFLKDFFQISGNRQSLSLRSNLWSQIAFVSIFFAVTLFALYNKQSKYSEDFEDFDHQAFFDFHYSDKINPKFEFKSDHKPFLGNTEAPITVVEFLDYQCPGCRMANMNVKPYLKQHFKNVKLVIMNYPLDNACNPNIKQVFHPFACEAAKAATCASEQGKFWELHDSLFENQKGIDPNKIAQLAKNAGVNEESFNQCMQSEETIKKIQSDIQQASNANIKGTPSIFFNGRLLNDWGNPAKINLLVGEELKRAKNQISK